VAFAICSDGNGFSVAVIARRLPSRRSWIATVSPALCRPMRLMTTSGEGVGCPSTASRTSPTRISAAAAVEFGATDKMRAPPSPRSSPTPKYPRRGSVSSAVCAVADWKRQSIPRMNKVGNLELIANADLQ
jgi:hypothetical protein